MTEVDEGLGEVAELGGERAADGVVEVVALNEGAARDRLERGEAGGGDGDAGDGDGAVHGGHGGGFERDELVEDIAAEGDQLV